MSNSAHGKSEAPLRLVSDEEAAVFPEGAPATDETPTVISKTKPIVSPSNQDKIIDLGQNPDTPEAIVAGIRGRRLAHFELIEPIGVGGMAAVIRARDTQLDRFVALKILPPEMAHHKGNVERFHQEAKAAAKLDHANIARVFFCGEDQGLHFIAFEFVEGMNLRTILEQRGRLPVAEAVRYILQIASGLEHAASRGVVHRDVKPSNIIITPHGQAKLVDMGLARNMERKGQRDLTQSGVTLGTFDYISPEQALEPREADTRSDIYSLGCTFYHLLTGCPPVPDGTPAKKLDYHQHHAPVDPRQMNPDIPDEIVAILSKMMEKDPDARYQRPIHLVHHLMQTAQKVGAADDAPEGMLFVDAPLPTPPQSRPVLIVGLALAALAAVVLILSFAPDPAPRQPAKTNGPTDEKSQPVARTNVSNGTPNIAKPKEPTAHDRPVVVTEFKDLQDLFSDPPAGDAKAHIGDYIPQENTGLVFKGGADQRLTLESDLDNFRTIAFRHKDSGSQVGISLEGGQEVVFRRVRFKIDADSTPTKAAAAVAIRGVKSVRFVQCLFVQNFLQSVQIIGKQRVPLASVLIEGSADGDDQKPTVSFSDCYFDGNTQSGGQVAVAVNGAANVIVKNCAFRPHNAFFSLRAKCTVENTNLSVQNCVGLVESGPAFRLHADASAAVNVRDTVFTRPTGTLPVKDGFNEQPGLIFLAGSGLLKYSGQDNLYHNLNALIELKRSAFIAKMPDFRAFVRKNGGEDIGSETLPETKSPLQNASRLGRIEDPLAFQLTEQYHRKVGLLSTWIGKLEDPPALVKKTAPREKIVDPDDETSRTLEGALADAVNGDVIYIKHREKSREVAVAPVTLKPNVSVTLKPYAGHYPILVFNDPKELDAALFKVQRSSLLIEDMNILVDPVPKYRSRSIVQMGESAHLAFKHCTFSLRASDDNVDLSVVSFLEIDKMAKMEGPSPAASRVEFTDCFVRGKGDLISLNGCRKLSVKVKNSVIALNGSLLDIHANSKPMPMSEGVTWEMDRSSIFTSESLFRLRAEDPDTVLTTTHAAIRDCLLTSLVPERPIVEMPIDENFKKCLKWDCSHNFYANFDKDKLKDWKNEFSELRSEYEKLTISAKLADLWDMPPAALRPTDAEQLDRISDFGRPENADPLLLPMRVPEEPSPEPQ